MIRSMLLAIAALSGFSVVDASAAEVTVSYKGVVTQANGTQQALFTAGQEISISYVVETTTADNNPSTSAGVYFNGLKGLRITVAGAGVDVVAGAGTVQTFNDHPNPTAPTDQAFFYSTASSGALQGLPVGHAEVDFIDNDVGSNGTVVMLASDEIPTSRLLSADSFVTFGTSSGYTYVHFLMEVDEPAATCADEGFTGVQLKWCQNICENGLTGKVLDTWIHRWISRYRTLPACAAPAQ